MMNVSHKIMSFLMSFVVLFSTLSFTVNMHYCGNTLSEITILGEAKGCGMEMGQPSKEDNCSIFNENCCDERQIIIDGQDELKLNFNNFTFEQQQFVLSFVHTYIAFFEGLDRKESSYEEYEPPLVVKQIFKIDETYLI